MARKQILFWFWGAATVAFYFLSWQKLGVPDMPQPNGFLFLAIPSTLTFFLLFAVNSYIEDGK